MKNLVVNSEQEMILRTLFAQSFREIWRGGDMEPKPITELIRQLDDQTGTGKEGMAVGQDVLGCPNCGQSQLYAYFSTSVSAPLRQNNREGKLLAAYVNDYEFIVGELDDEGHSIHCQNCHFELTDTGYNLPDMDEHQVAASSNYLKSLEKAFDRVDIC